MVHRVKAPEVVVAVKKTVCPILEQVSDKKSKDKFDDEGQLLNPLMKTAQADPSKKQPGWLLGDDSEKLYKKVAHDKINQVGAPFLMKLALVFIFRQYH